MTFGQQIKEGREAIGLKQIELARQLGIGVGYLSRIESDQKNMNKVHLLKISQILRISITELKTLWLANKLLNIVEGEKEGFEALKVAEQQIEYVKKN